MMMAKVTKVWPAASSSLKVETGKAAHSAPTSSENHLSRSMDTGNSSWALSRP